MERENQGKGKRQKMDDPNAHLSQEERLKMSTAPYWNIPYPEQVCYFFFNLPFYVQN